MIENAINATHAIVSLDVPLPSIIWGWMITLNMWAKSIGRRCSCWGIPNV